MGSLLFYCRDVMMKNCIYPFWQTAGAAEYGLLKSVAVVF